jgi:hypothetical protein
LRNAIIRFFPVRALVSYRGGSLSARNQHRRGQLSLFSLFFPKFTAIDDSFSAEILDFRRLAGLKNSEFVRCFPLYFAVFRKKNAYSAMLPMRPNSKPTSWSNRIASIS